MSIPFHHRVLIFACTALVLRAAASAAEPAQPAAPVVAPAVVTSSTETAVAPANATGVPSAPGTIEAPAATTSPAATAAGAPVPSTLFSFRADNVPLKQALALFARANHLNIVPDLDIDGAITVEFHDLPLDLAMQALLEANGYYFVDDGRLLRVRNRETRIFQIDYIKTTRTGQGSNAVQISSGGGSSAGSSGGSPGGGSSASSSGSEGSTMTVTNTSTNNFWGDLNDQLKSMVSPTGSYTVNSLAGTVLVRDNHHNIAMISDYLTSVTASIVRQVDIEVEIYEVALNNSSQLGINWQAVSNRLNTTLTSLPGTGATGLIAALPSSGGLIVQTPVFGTPPGAPGAQVQWQHGNNAAVLDALKQQGDLKVVSRPRLRTLNNQPAVVRIGQDLPVFMTQVTQSPGTPPIITTNETIQTITVGTVLSITPQISSNGLITLDVTPAVSRLVGIATSASGNTNAPVIDIRQASSIVRVRDGATVIMGGLVEDTLSDTKRKIPGLGDIPLVGKAFTGDYKSGDKTELVFFLTPRIVADPATEKSIKTNGN